jgi:tetratricopeptide (TPR) repeat protein
MKLKLLLLLLVVFQFNEAKSQTNLIEDTIQQNTSVSDSLMCREQLSLYREYHKIKLYAYALPHWRWVFFNCPSLTQNIYIDGIKIIGTRIEEAKDDSLRYKLIDTLMMVYDQRIKYYGREGYVLGRKAVDALTNNPAMAEQAFPWLARSVELQGNNSEGAVLVYYLTTAIQLASTNAIDKSEIFNVYDKAITIAEQKITEAASDEKTLTSWVNVKANIEMLIEPHASCADLVGIYGKKFQESPNDTALLRNITTILDRKNCTEEGDLFYKAAGNLHKLLPGAQSAYLMGRLSIQNNDLNSAATYMQEAAELYTDTVDKIKALYALAGIYSNTRNFTQARNTAQKIIQLNPNEGKAYIIIGDLYAMSAGMCDADDLGGKTVFWAAIDKYIKAKSVDGSVESQANEKIAQYVKYYPPTSDLFFRDMQEGESYTVGCWINETTTIRGSK